ncbi:hypothetical protein M408DRAFT_326962 [Serendipita vermifera MAFF 305830]|uniref:Uncharacterized protein n=1 Tax=Serendipita vermifera MAFF 305830 TaxID=933852 RepID=A0A0C3B6B5_SERVB|nr:hypothetical protein M408DRAFT_326962 [Serendipita vermifera MAFF 305830]
MSPTKSLFAALVFSGVVVCAVYTVAIHLDASGGQKLLENTCPPSVVNAYSKQYGTGIFAVDSVLCGMDTLFKTSFEEPIKDFMTSFLLNGPVCLFVLLLESSRSDKPYVAFAPLLFGILTQTITAAIASSVFWTLFVVQACFGGSRQGRTPVSRTAVEAALLAVLIGYLIPTAWMMVTKSSLAIVLWHPCVVYMSAIQNGWTWYRGATPAGSGFGMAQWALLFFCAVGSITWANTILLPHVSKTFVYDLWEWLPSAAIPDPRSTTLQSAVLHLLQYDAAWMFGSTLLAALFLSDEIKDTLFTAQILPATVAAFGPGAVVGGLWIFRELQLVAAAHEASSKPKTE